MKTPRAAIRRSVTAVVFIRHSLIHNGAERARGPRAMMFRMFWFWKHRHSALIIALAGGAFVIGVLIWQERISAISGENAGRDSIIYDIDAFERYNSARFGISFFYPKGYHLEEREVGDALRYRTTIVLTEDTEENRLVREGK